MDVIHNKSLDLFEFIFHIGTIHSLARFYRENIFRRFVEKRTSKAFFQHFFILFQAEESLSNARAIAQLLVLL